MKRILMIVGASAALVLSACGGSSSDETPTPTAPRQTPEQVQVESTEEVIGPTYTPYPTYAPPATDTPAPADAATVAATADSEVAAPATPGEPDAQTPAPTATATPKASPAPLDTPTPPVSQASAGQPVELPRIEDTNPGPPFAVLVSTIRIQDDGSYKLTGRIRNDGSQVYGGVGVLATFFTDAQPPNQHSLRKVYGACQLLAPGAECPFSVEISPRDYVSYLLHPDATPVEYHQPAPLSLSNLSVQHGWVGHVRITGTATNENPFPVRDAYVSGMLIDAAGQIVSVGLDIVPGEIAPGASVSFDLHIDEVPYARYELEAQAIQD